MISSMYDDDKPEHPTMVVQTPYHGWHSEATFNGYFINQNLQFFNFN